MSVVVFARFSTLIVNSLLFSLNCWFTLRTIQTVRQSLNEESVLSSVSVSADPHVLTVNVPPKLHHQISSSRLTIPTLKSRSNDDKPRWTMRITVMSSLCFLIASSFSLCNQVITIYHIGWNERTPDHRLNSRVIRKGSPYRYASAICQLFGYSFLCVVCMERYRMIVEKSQFKLDDSTVRLVRIIIGVNLIIVFATVPVDIALGPLASALLAIPPIICYPMICCWISLRLLRSSADIANRLDRCSYLSSMLDGSVRLSLITLVAVSSTMLVSVAFLTIALKENVITYVIFDIIWVLDSTVNTACLLFTFHRSQKIYHFFLGWLHTRVIRKMTSQESPSQLHSV